MVAMSAFRTVPTVRSMWMLEWVVGFYAVALMLASIAVFMIGNASQSVSELITEQNDAALKLWVNLDYYEHHRAAQTSADTSLPPGLFSSIVVFSRNNATIIKTLHRLGPWRMFAPGVSFDEVARYLKPIDGQPVKFDHVGVDPHTDTVSVVNQGMYQIELYQAIRDYAQDEAGLYKGCLLAISVYVMPVLYALLGAFLWAFRSSCQQASLATQRDVPLDRSSRFLMAAIAGIAISSFGTLLPKDIALSPLAVAFILGYSIDIFMSRLDAYIAGLIRHAPAQGAETRV